MLSIRGEGDVQLISGAYDNIRCCIEDGRLFHNRSPHFALFESFFHRVVIGFLYENERESETKRARTCATILHGQRLAPMSVDLV